MHIVHYLILALNDLKQTETYMTVIDESPKRLLSTERTYFSSWLNGELSKLNDFVMFHSVLRNVGVIYMHAETSGPARANNKLNSE